MPKKKKQPRVQVWVDADLAREARVRAANLGVRTANVASEALRAGLFLPKKASEASATQLRQG